MSNENKSIIEFDFNLRLKPESFAGFSITLQVNDLIIQNIASGIERRRHQKTQNKQRQQNFFHFFPSILNLKDPKQISIQQKSQGLKSCIYRMYISLKWGFQKLLYIYFSLFQLLKLFFLFKATECG